MSLPATIKHPIGFAHSPASGFDGVFDWSWTQGCFGEGRITPMDFDGVVERKGNFLLFETKNLNVPIPKGQLFTLEAAHRLGCFTVFLIHGKTEPESIEIWYPGVSTKETIKGKHAAAIKVSKWYSWADSNPSRPVNLSILNRRVQVLESDLDGMKRRISEASTLLTKAVEMLAGEAA